MIFHRMRELRSGEHESRSGEHESRSGEKEKPHARQQLSNHRHPKLTFRENEELLPIYSFKADFQSVLRTLESLFLFFVLLHVRYHKMLPFRNYLHKVLSKFKTNRHYGYEAVEAYYDYQLSKARLSFVTKF